MNIQLYRHGDILIKAEKLPNNQNEIFSGKSYVVAVGEHTNHKHVLSSDTDIKVYKDELGNRYLLVGGMTSIIHEEHKELIIAPGTYKIDQEREFDYMLGEISKVQD